MPQSNHKMLEAPLMEHTWKRDGRTVFILHHPEGEKYVRNQFSFTVQRDMQYTTEEEAEKIAIMMQKAQKMENALKSCIAWADKFGMGSDEYNEAVDALK